LITRLESCTNGASQNVRAPRAKSPVQDAVGSGLRSQVALDLLLLVCTSAYLVLVLFDDMESPLVSIALIFLVAYELIQPRAKGRRATTPSRSPRDARAALGTHL
jgi:hypothetical protein